MVCGLLMRLPVLALRLAPSAEPARHMTETILPGSGFSAGTANRQLCRCHRCEHLCEQYNTKEGIVQVLMRQNELKPLKRGKGFYPSPKLVGFTPYLCNTSARNGDDAGDSGADCRR